MTFLSSLLGHRHGDRLDVLRLLWLPPEKLADHVLTTKVVSGERGPIEVGTDGPRGGAARVERDGGTE